MHSVLITKYTSKTSLFPLLAIDTLLHHTQWQIQDFPEVGRQPSGEVPTYDFTKFSQKLDEIESIWTRGRGVQNFTM